MIKKLLTLVFGLTLASMAFAAQPVAGKDYKVLDEPVPTDLPAGKIDVTEVFWFGCPHCYALNPALEKWVAHQKDDVNFELLPATMGRTWVRHATAYYAAEELGIEKKMHDDFFDAIHKDGRQLTDDGEIADFFTHYGVSREAALKALNSFGVKSEINEAHAKMRAYKLMGVPALVINGKYVITPNSAGGLDNMMVVASSLIDDIRNGETP
ncbi:thiol:disulfide interchange protein DsbA/DsbL [Larsenimonas rhizosphaerae]|uniref:Thiol:disulfide interchange protein n=1 Tax=Larsenimonas rhizosphaerae TaxID=2944682 RepID=A0AA41ZNI8_9GAMM|nr:thiol:disulfide interchange protein DsbA/DsbL [Larsenimonas rhizosphaerae]MCM2131496.1 thiol:disulfide interchange protein DsbA/DsbL [Larsenimonas rhizosphaerae]MCX2525178.1 thiol:disulfide interchange protein DsbA/DsbL [Larsenimonas rhizosphaerae]